MKTMLTRKRRGFTLIELLIVVIIIGILIAIGVPAYLKYTGAANDRDAQSALQVAYKAAIAGDTEVNSSRFPIASTIVQDIRTDEPASSVVRGVCTSVGTATVKQVIVDTASTAQQLTLCTKSASGAIWKLTGPLTGTPTVADGSVVPFTFSGSETTDAVRAAGLQGDGLPADSSTGVWESSTNMVTRSDYDGTNRSAQAGWQTGQDTANGASSTLTLVSDPTFPVDSANVGQWTTNEPTGSGWAYMAVGVGQAVAPFTSGQTYTVSFWMEQTAGAAQPLTVKISDSNSTNQIAPSQTFTPSNTIQRFSFSFAATVSGNTPVVFVNPAGAGAGSSTYRLTGFQVEQQVMATPLIRTTGTSATRAAGRVQAPATALNETQGWFAARLRIGYPSTATPGNYSGLAAWGPAGTGDPSIELFRFQNGWRMERCTASCTSAVISGLTWNRGDLVTVVGSWTATQMGISVNGSSFTTSPNTLIPSLSANTTFDIGAGQYVNNALRWTDGDILWFACGTGTVSNGDAATINAYGNADPSRASFPAATQAVMVWNGTSSAGSLK